MSWAARYILALLIPWMVAGCQSLDTSGVMVTSTGSGPTRRAAIRQAILCAAGQATGTLIVGEQVERDDRLVKDQVLQQMSGIVQQYSIRSCGHGDDGDWTCRVTATVSTTAIPHVTQTDGARVEGVDGKDASALQLSYRSGLQQQRRMLLDALGRLDSSGVTVRSVRMWVVPTDGRAVVRVDARLGVSPQYLDYLDRIVRRGFRKAAVHLHPLRITVIRPGLFAGADTQIIEDDPLVEAIRAELLRQRSAGLRVKFLGRNGAVVARACPPLDLLPAQGWNHPQMLLFPNLHLRFDPGLTWDVADDFTVPQSVLRNIRSAVVRIGCAEGSSDIDDSPKA